MSAFRPTTPPRGSGKSIANFEPFVPIDPLNMRALLFLGVAEGMVLQRDWPYRAVTITMESPAVSGRLGFYGANHIDAITAVDQGLIDFSILNPSALLTMAYRGAGAFDRPHNVAVIAVLPHNDQLGFAVSDRLGFRSLKEIAETKYPLRVSTRGSLDVCTSIMVDQVLRTHGFCLDDLRAWGGEVYNDQPMPQHPSRIGRLAAGEIDAIFDEGVVGWANRLAGAGARFLPIATERLIELEAQGFRRGLIERDRFDTLTEDVPTLDFGGWPIYCRADTPDDLVDRFCRTLLDRRDQLPWQMGPAEQPRMPLELMARDAIDTPRDVPLHPRAAAIWAEHGWTA